MAGLLDPGRELTRRPARWIDQLMGHEVPAMTWVPGRTLTVPDALSRRPDLMLNVPDPAESIPRDRLPVPRPPVQTRRRADGRGPRGPPGPLGPLGPLGLRLQTRNTVTHLASVPDPAESIRPVNPLSPGYQVLPHFLAAVPNEFSAFSGAGEKNSGARA